jgi:hypothetical protein
MNINDIKPIPGFSCLKMKQEIQEKIYCETKHMTKNELHEYLQKKIERRSHEKIHIQSEQK